MDRTFDSWLYRMDQIHGSRFNVASPCEGCVVVVPHVPAEM